MFRFALNMTATRPLQRSKRFNHSTLDRCELNSSALSKRSKRAANLSRNRSAFRSRSDTNSVRCRLELVGAAAKARTSASFLLASRDFALLHSAGRGCDLFEHRHATRRRHLSMGQARLQRVRRIYRCLESLATFDHGHRTRRNVHYHQYFLRDRAGAAWMPNSKWCVSLI